MDEKAVFLAHLNAYLTDSLKEGLAFDIAHGTADLGDDDIRIGILTHCVDEGLYLICDMRDYLNRLTQVISVALLFEHVGVYLACGQVRKLIKVFVDEALIVSQIKVCLSAVLSNIYLAVLIGAHCAGIHIYIGIKLLRGDLESSCLEQTSEGSGSNALAETRNYSTRYENELFAHHNSMSPSNTVSA